jgi:AraC-like DNA-binding protein
MSRPKKIIDWDIVEKCIEAGCSAKEISSKFRIDTDTFYGRFKQEFGCGFQDYSAKCQSAGIADLKLMVHAKALNNKVNANSNLLIFLCRCRLGMREPEALRTESPHQSAIDQSHIIMQLQHKIAMLEASNDNKSKTK